MPVPTRQTIVDLVTASVGDVLDTMGSELRPAVLNEESPLFGEAGLLDSMGLVTLVVDVERRLYDRFGLAIRLADERAMSRRNSPFRRVGALTDHIMALLTDTPHE